MKIRPLIIDESVRESIGSLLTYAEKNPITMDYLLDQKNGEERPPGDFQEYTRILPFGYRVVFTLELQPAGKVRHLSISVDEDGKLPNEIAVQEIMTLIGFQKQLRGCRVHLENISPKRQAINVIEIIK